MKIKPSHLLTTGAAVAIANRTPNDAHWYTLAGAPSHTNDKGNPTTLREARRENLLPSITTVLGVVDAKGLNRWRENQIAEAVHGATQADGEPLIEFFRRCIEEARAVPTEAAERGKAIHAVAEATLLGKEIDPGEDVQKRAVIDWIVANVTKVYFAEKPLVHPELAMAGCADACVDIKGVQGRVVLDFKTRKFKSFKTHPTWRAAWYPKDLRQLAFYADCLPDDPAPRVANIGINTATNDPWPAEVKLWEPDEVAAAIDDVAAARVLWCSENKYHPAFTVEKFLEIYGTNAGVLDQEPEEEVAV